MAQLKNIHLLTDLSEADLVEMEHAATEHLKQGGISFKILEVDDNAVTIGALQRKNAAGAIHEQKRLIEIVHESFDRFFPGKKILVHATPYLPSPAEAGDAAWINKQMLDTGTRLKHIAADTGVDYTSLSAFVNDTKPMSQSIKAMFYFYFLSKR